MPTWEFRLRLRCFQPMGWNSKDGSCRSLEDKCVASMERSASGFRIGLGDGEVVTARKIIIALGLSGFEHVPPILSALGRTMGDS